MKSIFFGSALLATSTLSFKMQNDQSTAIAVNDPTECIKEHCPKQYANCEKDPKCLPALQDCEKKCGTKTSCWQFCLPAKGSQAAIDVAKCAASNHCLSSEAPEESTAVALVLSDPTECIKEHCPTQYANCEKDPKCLPALEDCEKKCGTKTSCWQFCLPAKGSQAAIDVAKCAAANHCLSSESGEESTALVLAVSDPTECIKEHCPKQYANCEKDPKCLPALQDCEKKCGTKTSCWQFCLPAKGSQAAIDVAKCAASNHCLSSEAPEESTAVALVVSDPTECIKEHCPTQYANCEKDPKCLPALQDCEKKCGTKTSCWQFCLPAKGSQAAIDVAKCAASNHCLETPSVSHPFEQCIAKDCSHAFSFCLADSECRASLRLCRNPAKVWDFSLECLSIRSEFNEKLKDFFTCAGQTKCI